MEPKEIPIFESEGNDSQSSLQSEEQDKKKICPFTCKSSDDNNQNSILQFGESLFDCVAVVLICREHKNLALSKINSSKGLWFPIFPIKSGQSFLNAINKFLEVSIKKTSTDQTKIFGTEYEFSISLIDFLKFQVPIYFEFVSRFLFFYEISSLNKNCCQPNSFFGWYPFNSLANLSDLWSEEPRIYSINNFTQFSNKINFSDFTIKELVAFLNHSGPHQSMLLECGCNQESIQLLYVLFIQHCYPSKLMNYYSFLGFVSKHKLDLVDSTDKLALVYRAFIKSYDSSDQLNFEKFIFGLAVMDKRIPHEQFSEIRARYIFSYYNSNSSNQLFYEDICRFVKDLFKVNGGTYMETKTETQFEQKIQSIYEKFDVASRTPISEEIFFKQIISLKLLDISSLFRANNSPINQLCMKNLAQEIKLVNNKLSIGSLGLKMQYLKGICSRCKDKSNILASHYVKLSQSGIIFEPKKVEGISPIFQQSKYHRRLSNLMFFEHHFCNELIDMIRNISENNLQSIWFQKKNLMSSIDKILKICNDSEKLFSQEKRCIKIQSPVYVFGDIHGNLSDLMIFEKTLWPLGPSCLTASYLFLGDYVDRGLNSIECIVYLLCSKLLLPHRFYLLRGNHEIRNVQKAFSFYKECLIKFEKAGNVLWEAFNKVFDMLPLCATIDEKIFCAHGGIPKSVTKIDDLTQELSCPMPDPYKVSLAWEMLWNDPISNKDYNKIKQIQQEKIDDYGFLPNTKRGTAFFFSDEAVENFCSTNGFTHIIRAHEVVPLGYQLNFGGRVITVFSSSKYCGLPNEAAVILVSMNKIRIICVDNTQ